MHKRVFICTAAFLCAPFFFSAAMADTSNGRGERLTSCSAETSGGAASQNPRADQLELLMPWKQYTTSQNGRGQQLQIGLWPPLTYLHPGPADTDGDGLLDEVETNTGIYVDETDTGTDPDDPDTDSDGLSDGYEVNTHGTDPNEGDSDDDGLSDAVETNTGNYVDETDTGSDPNDPHTDDDQIPDGWEVDNGLDPNDPTGDNGADGDPDGDGLTNLEEYQQGYDPQLAAPVAAFSASMISGMRPLAVDFVDESTGAITSRSWDFGDGYDSSEQNPSHTYYFIGDFTVTLMVAGPGGVDTETATIHVDQLLVGGGGTGPPRDFGYEAVIRGVKVTCSTAGCWAWYNHLQDSLLIAVWGDESGVLKVVAKEDAPLYWDDRCDVVIDAPDTYIKKIVAKGIQDQMDMFVCGQAGYIKNFILKDGYVGNTLHYGEEFGLGSDALDPSKKVLIKRGAATAPVLGIGYPELRYIPASVEEALASLEMSIKLKSKSFCDVLDDEEDIDDEEYKLAELTFAEVEASVETKAAYVADIDGVKVRYSLPGCAADYNDEDDTLTIQISDSDGDLTVKCGEDAHFDWGDYCDVYIDAPDASVNNMILKGRPETQLHVCGEVAHVKNFKLKYGCVGNTDCYGEEYGLCSTRPGLPNKILIKWGWTTAPLLGVSY